MSKKLGLALCDLRQPGLEVKFVMSTLSVRRHAGLVTVGSRSKPSSNLDCKRPRHGLFGGKRGGDNHEMDWIDMY